MSGRRIGFVIGNNYPKWDKDKQLKFAVADAIKIKEILENKNICDFEHVVLLTNKSSRDAQVGIEKLFRTAGQDDLIFVYFSGHGKKDFTNDLYLLFEDTDEESPISTSLSFDFINKCRKYPSALKSSVVIVLDCCYSASAGMKDTNVMETFKSYCSTGTVILSATGSTGSQTAMEDEKLGHSFFTYYLIEGLEKGYADKNGKGYVFIDELYSYAFDKTKDNCSQSPKKEGSVEGTIFIGKNPLRLREKDYELKKKKLFGEFGTQLHPRILDESLKILRKNYDNSSSMEKVEITINRYLESLLNYEFSVESYSDAVQHLKEININVSTNVLTPLTKNFADIPRHEIPTIESTRDYNTSGNSVSEDKPKYQYNFGSVAKHEVPRIRDTVPDSIKINVPKTFTSPSTGMQFVLIPAGKFIMGSNEYDKQPIHKVTIRDPFYFGISPVTQDQWAAIMHNSPSRFQGGKNPVENVSWDKVQTFLRKLNQKEGTDKYRLPSEAEWEYSCRAGTTSKYFFGEDESKLMDYAWCSENSFWETHSVGLRKPNPWGLYDMYGNVSEWCQDKYHVNYNGAPSDGSAWEDNNGYFRVTRNSHRKSNDYRSVCRSYWSQDQSSEFVGFRILRTL